MTAPTLPEQIASLNAVSELIAANYGALDLNGWGPEAVQAQLDLGRQRALLEWLQIHGEAIRKAVSESRSVEGLAHD
jgi:hypothetical protein